MGGGCAVAFVAVFVSIGVGAVVIDPTSAFGYCWLVTLAVVLVLVYASGRRTAKLREHGVQAWADILAAEETGVLVNNDPVVRLTLRVRPPDGAAYETQSRETVPLIALGRLTGGGPVRLHLDPADRTRFVIDWTATPPEADASDAPDAVERVRRLDELKAEGLISDAEYAEHRARILGEL